MSASDMYRLLVEADKVRANAALIAGKIVIATGGKLTDALNSAVNSYKGAANNIDLMAMDAEQTATFLSGKNPLLTNVPSSIPDISSITSSAPITPVITSQNQNPPISIPFIPVTPVTPVMPDNTTKITTPIHNITATQIFPFSSTIPTSITPPSIISTLGVEQLKTVSQDVSPYTNVFVFTLLGISFYFLMKK